MSVGAGFYEGWEGWGGGRFQLWRQGCKKMNFQKVKGGTMYVHFSIFFVHRVGAPEHVKHNCMPPSNLGIVFGPNLLKQRYVSILASF